MEVKYIHRQFNIDYILYIQKTTLNLKLFLFGVISNSITRFIHFCKLVIDGRRSKADQGEFLLMLK